SRLREYRSQCSEEEGDCLETHLRTTPRFSVGRTFDLWSSKIPCPNRDNTRFEQSRPSPSRHEWSEPVRGQRASQACSGYNAALVAGRHQPRIEAKSRIAAFTCGYPLGPRTALGAVKRSLTT